MSVPSIVIADAVVALLNGSALSIDVTFSRVYVPKFDTQNAVTVQGLVVPKSDAREMGSSADDNATVLIDIGLMKRLQNAVTDEVAEIDAIMALCEEIKAVVNRERLASDTAVCIGTTQEPMYSVEEIENGRVFLTAITANFMATVAV